MNVLYSHNDTITAIATPLGTGGVAVVRISGTKSEKIIAEIFSVSLKEKKVPDFKANSFYYGRIIDSSGIPVDEVIVLCFKAPHSYTGEDVFEIQCHGGINVVKNILKLCLKSGARLAQRGEFSKRAFMNGKLDLSKAEAVLDLIHSKTDKFSKAAAGNLSGNLSKHVNNLRKELLDLLSIMTAAIDFPEEVDEPEYFFLEEKLKYLIEKINDILKTANSSNLMRDGLKVALAGKPNVGKSSLFNALLDTERAIVTEIPGTTRDIIQESLDVDGIPVILTDTAGIRDLNIQNSSDYIESIGINNTKTCIESADLILFVYDLTQGMQEEDLAVFEEIKHKKVIKIGSKADLPHILNDRSDVLVISSKERSGPGLIKNEIKKFLITDDVSGEFCTNTRQQECLVKSGDSLKQALNACRNNEIQDLISIDLKAALLELGEITGEVVSEEIINNIFENFCIGK